MFENRNVVPRHQIKATSYVPFIDFGWLIDSLYNNTFLFSLLNYSSSKYGAYARNTIKSFYVGSGGGLSGSLTAIMVTLSSTTWQVILFILFYRSTQN